MKKKTTTTTKKIIGKPLIARTTSNNINSDLITMASQYGGNESNFNSDTYESDAISRFPAEIRNPTLNPEMFFLPKFLSNDGSPNIELNTWFDHYYRFHPLVGNLIDLHKTLPLSRFGLVGVNDTKMLQEYEELSEDLQMFEVASEMFKAYFLRGEYALYGRWNDDIKSFNHLKLLDTNYINVTGHHLLFSDRGEDTEVYELTPDEYLQSLVNTDNEVYQQLVDNYLDDEVREAIENNFTIMLDPFTVSFEKRTVNSWDLRGTSILCNILKTLILEDKLREYQYCHDSDTECLTDNGWKKYNELSKSDLIATMNPNTNELEYQNPTDINIQDYSGKMISFHNRNLDIMVTPNHRMWVKSNEYSHSVVRDVKERPYSYSQYKLSDWQFVEAKDVKLCSKVRKIIDKYTGNIPSKTITIDDIVYDYKDYLSIVGYYLSEGYLDKKFYNRNTNKLIVIYQSKKSIHIQEMVNLFNKYGWTCNLKNDNYTFSIRKKEHWEHFEQFGVGALNKQIPSHIKSLGVEYLEELMRCAINGDGSIRKKRKREESNFDKAFNTEIISYASISKQLIDDMQEIAFKCGYNPNLRKVSKGLLKKNKKGFRNDMYCVGWSANKDGFNSFPNITSGVNGCKSEIDYEGKTWCVTVPNGIFITRRNGKIAIQGNSNAQANTTPIYLWNVGDNEYPADDEMIRQTQSLIQNLAYDPNKNIIANHLLKLTIQGASGEAKDMHQDFEYIQNLILTSLWGNKAFTTSEGITYNSSSVAMRVLMGRYIPIRNGLENIFYRKIFLPIAIARGYYKRTEKDRPNGKSAMIKTSKNFNDLVIPKFDWRHKQSLMDDSNVRSMLIQLHQMGKIPFKTICDSLDLDYDYTMTWLEKESNTIFDPYLNDAKKTLIQSAMAGGLADKGEGMMKRIMDASSSFMKAVIGKSPNVNVIDKGKDDDKEKDKKEDAQQDNNTKDDKEQKETEKTFGFDKTADIEKIIRKNAKNVEKQLSEPRRFKSVYSSNDLLIKKLSDNYYDKDFIDVVKGQLYDLKILLSKQGTEYINEKTSGVVNEKKKTTAQECVNYVLSFNKEEYNKRLRSISEIAIDKTDNSINKEANSYHLDFNKYALDYTIDELEVTDKPTLSSYWKSVSPKLELESVLNFVDLYRRKQIQSYRKNGVKEFYVNGIKTDVDNYKFKIEDRLIPNNNYEDKKSIKISKNFTAENIPTELIYTVKDLDKRFKLRGRLDYSEDTFDTVIDKTSNYYLGFVYDNMNTYDEVVDLEAKYSSGEKDEREFFINQGRKYLNNETSNEEIKEYFKNLYI